MRRLLLKLSDVVEIIEASKPVPSDYGPAPSTEFKQAADVWLCDKCLAVVKTAVAFRVRVLDRSWNDINERGDDDEDTYESENLSHHGADQLDRDGFELLLDCEEELYPSVDK
ncbi:hypothetical protein ON010_g11868 [Phytophthora cinnamomi]|nr:hypothetical protein ON010_g11868 [Phytophthora cinnamomi]